MGHAAPSTLVTALKRRRAHPALIAAAQRFRCEACARAQRAGIPPVSSGRAERPGDVLGTDIFYWTHPNGHKAA
eukprot:656923-Alexandrium_andersonii.AAC.1